MANNASVRAKLNIHEVNRLSCADFVKLFGAVIYDTPFAASAVWARRPFRTVEELHMGFTEFLDALPSEGKQAVLRFLPNLGGKLARRRQLQPFSLQEQESAGLLGMTQHHINLMEELNKKYYQKFGFPFVICVRENKWLIVLEQLPECLQHSKDQEIERAIKEVQKICWYRIQELVEDSNEFAKL